MNNTMDLKAHHTIKLQNANNKEPVDNNQYVPKIQVCMFHMQLKMKMQQILTILFLALLQSKLLRFNN